MLINEALYSLVASAALVGIAYGTYVVVIVLLRRWRLRKLTKEIKKLTKEIEEYQARQRRYEAQRNNKPWVSYTRRRLHDSVR